MEEILTNLRNEVDQLRHNLPCITHLNPEISKQFQTKASSTSAASSTVAAHVARDGSSLSFQKEENMSLNPMKFMSLPSSRYLTFMSMDRPWKWYVILGLVLAIFFYCYPPTFLYVNKTMFSYTRWCTLVTGWTLFIWVYWVMMKKCTRSSSSSRGGDG